MSSNFSCKIKNILSVGLPLHDEGIFNWALTQEQAIKALEIFLIEKIPILGGDVYYSNGSTLEPNYDSWFFEYKDGTTQKEFLENSIKKAFLYIKNYPSENIQNTFFVLTPKN